jgi:hypothetical protein
MFKYHNKRFTILKSGKVKSVKTYHRAIAPVVPVIEGKSVRLADIDDKIHIPIRSIEIEAIDLMIGEGICKKCNCVKVLNHLGICIDCFI